jgi:hypothetical protein
MDAFQGSYRIQPYDLRYFSAFYLFIRLIVILQFYVYVVHSHFRYFTSGMLFFLSAAVVVIFEPYKVRAHNTVDCVLMILTGIVYFSYYAHDVDFKVVDSFRLLSASLLVLYFISVLMLKLIGGKLQVLVGKIKAVWSSIVHHPKDCCEGEVVESFDRELNHERNSYPQLLCGSHRSTS